MRTLTIVRIYYALNQVELLDHLGNRYYYRSDRNVKGVFFVGDTFRA